ncbi:MAG: FtsX-like permease family protein [bacterium]|nr:FtsX-like permease family protein [bacterium]
MFTNYIKITFRNFTKNKVFSFINVSGLAIGIAACVLMLGYIMDEFSYDTFHENSKNIYRVSTRGSIGGAPFNAAVAAPIAGPTFKEELPEIVDFVRIQPTGRPYFVYGDRKYYEDNMIFAEKNFFEFFSFKLLEGDPKTVLSSARTAVITRTVAAKYFMDEDPIGKTMQRNGTDITITGIVEEPPPNSHFTFDIIESLETNIARFPQQYAQSPGSWGNVSSYTYISLIPGVDYKEVDAKVLESSQKNTKLLKDNFGAILDNFLQPLESIHLNSNLRGEIGVNGSMTYIYTFSIIALFILVIACINFMNLSTARSANRAKEVGMRKVFGAYKSQLAYQFLGESFLYAIISLVIALGLVELFKPFANALFSKDLAINYLQTPVLSAALFGIVIFVGLFAGSYPALVLSRFKSVEVMKGNKLMGAKNSVFRNVLVVFQFSIAIALIVGTGIVLNQISFMKNKDLGFNKEQLLVLSTAGTTGTNITTAKIEFERINGVQKAGLSNLYPSGGSAPSSGVFPEGYSDNQAYPVTIINVDPDFIDTYEFQIVEGRNFSREITSDTANSILINETAARDLGWDDPIGKKIGQPSGGTAAQVQTTDREVIGVIKDIHFRSLHTTIEPLVIFYVPGVQGNGYQFITLKVNAVNLSETLNSLESKWNELYPQKPFEYQFVDDQFESQYATEEQLGNAVRSFTYLAVLIGCLGLFGLASFTAQQKRKEIGIRKVLGSSIQEIVLMLFKDFVKLILVSTLIAWPVSYYLMVRWLEVFPYKAELSLWVFVFSALIAGGVAIATVSYQSIKAAVCNPSDTIRNE